jgi:uncharacterized protein YqfA (UPF0365 family)
MKIDIIIICLSVIEVVIVLSLIANTKIGWYIRFRMNGVKISIQEVSQYIADNLPFKEIKRIHNHLTSNGIYVNLKDIIDQYYCGIDLNNVQDGLIMAKDNNLPLSFETACIADIREIDICETVKKKLLLDVEEKNI